MITENHTRPPANPLFGACPPRRGRRTLPRGSETPLPGDPVGSLIRAYRRAGLSTEAARRCAVADFQTLFPHLLTTGV